MMNYLAYVILVLQLSTVHSIVFPICSEGQEWSHLRWAYLWCSGDYCWRAIQSLTLYLCTDGDTMEIKNLDL